MAVKGDGIHSVADFIEGFGKTVEPIGDAASGVLGGVADPILNGFGRKARVVTFEEAEYQNAEDWTVGNDGSITVHASVQSGGTTIDLPEPIEFVHFGKVYRDDSHLFAASKIDDTLSGKVLSDTKNGSPVDIPAHGLMYRAALMRETVLLGGFIRAQMDALIAEEKSKGVVGVLSQVLADLTGSAGGTEDKPSPVDLNPHIRKVIDAGKKINVAKVDYPAVHAAGVELHTARKAYRKYLVDELAKRHAPAKTPDGGKGGLLNAAAPKLNKAASAGEEWWNVKDVVPKLTSIVPPAVQDFLSIVQKISFKAWDVYAGLIYEYAIRLEPIVEDACGAITVNAIKKRSTPIFPVWFLEAQTFPDPPKVAQDIFGKLENPVPPDFLPAPLDKVTKAINSALDVVTDPVESALKKVDQAVGIDKTLDFLSRPDAYTPGRPFLDDIFLIPPDADAPEVPNGEKRARVGWSGGLGDLAVTCMKGALGIDHLPGFLEWIVSKVSMVAAEFVRGVYCRLLTLKDSEQITEAEILEAAERHFVGNIIESILGGLKFVDQIRMDHLDFPAGHVSLSIDALIGRAKEFASQKLEQFIAPVISYAMKDLYAAIFAYRATAITNGAMTMEVHLAQLPILFARLFRNVFFPLWDRVIEKVLDSVTASLMPKVKDAALKIMHAKEEVDKVRTKILKTVAALDTLPKVLPDVGFDVLHPKDSIEKLKKDWNPIVDNAKAAYDKTELPNESTPKDVLESAFPLTKRIREAEATAVTDDDLKKVEPDLKWKVEKKIAAVTAPANGAAAATESSPANQKPAADPPSASSPTPLMMPFNYADPLPPSSPVPYSQPFAPKAGGFSQPEPTQQFQLAQNPAPFPDVNPEETVDLPGSAVSVLMPFQGAQNKAQTKKA